MGYDVTKVTSYPERDPAHKQQSRKLWHPQLFNAILFTDEDNIAALTAYRSLGFQRTADWGLILLKKLMAIA